MCTALTMTTEDFYMGRTLDHTCSYGEEVTITPRNFPLTFRHGPKLDHHFAFVGMACVTDNFPLYYDGFNEHGLAIAGLSFVDSARYLPPAPDRDNVASFEILPRLLGQCRSVAEARVLLENLRVTDTAFNRQFPPSPLHWLLADRQEAIVIEPMADGLHLYENPVGVLTNEPPFPEQLRRVSDGMTFSALPPENKLAPRLKLPVYSYGLGAMGLPGDLSSPSRFLQAVFARENSLCGTSEAESVSQFFHLLDFISQPRGCTAIAKDVWEWTLYAACFSTRKGIYYYRTYDSHQICAVDLRQENLDGSDLIRYPLRREMSVFPQNGTDNPCSTAHKS